MSYTAVCTKQDMKPGLDLTCELIEGQGGEVGEVDVPTILCAEACQTQRK